MYNFLKSNGFDLIQKETAVFLRDYYDIFSNGSFQIRFSGDKSIKAIDIRSSQPNETWYDLALVKALLYNEKKLNNSTTIREYELFLLKELGNIAELFNEKNYLNTKKNLEELGNERAEQMFPNRKSK